MQLSLEKIKEFQNHIRSFYKKHGRDLAWRHTTNPYHVLVSEIMLQQTQVRRVERKYPEFIKRFPDFSSLSRAPFSIVLREWQGMGYNRRAMALHQIAVRVMNDYGGELPQDPEILITFPGIGKATANSISAFAWDRRVAFIETNIRRVFIHHFFPRKKKVSDDAILNYVEATLPRTRIREWYWALMDYGTHLAATVSNPNKKSAHYRVQAKFKGSNREMRGNILRILTKRKAIDVSEMKKTFGKDSRIEIALKALTNEGFLKKTKERYMLV